MTSKENLLVDPLYPSLEEYAKDFDYDLLGKSIKLSTRFFADPRTHIEWWVREQHAEIIIIGTSLMLVLLILLFFKIYVLEFFISGIRSLQYFLTLRKTKKKYLKAEDADADDFAAAAYRKIVATRGLHKYRGDTDFLEYEAGRFNWEVVQETGLALEELVKSRKENIRLCKLQCRKPCSHNDLKRSEREDFYLDRCTC